MDIFHQKFRKPHKISGNPTKRVEQWQRAAQVTTGDFLFDLAKKANTPKKLFLKQTTKTNPDRYQGLWLS